ncbi:hypothetical protein ACLB2K_036090 [Fragaria x ananassa]
MKLQPDKLVNRGKITGHCLSVASVSAHPSGYIAASASLDSFVRIFDVDSNSTIASFEAPSSKVWQLGFNPREIFPTTRWVLGLPAARWVLGLGLSRGPRIFKLGSYAEEGNPHR